MGPLLRFEISSWIFAEGKGKTDLSLVVDPGGNVLIWGKEEGKDPELLGMISNAANGACVSTNKVAVFSDGSGGTDEASYVHNKTGKRIDAKIVDRCIEKWVDSMAEEMRSNMQPVPWAIPPEQDKG